MYRGKLGLEVPKNMSELPVEAQLNYKEKLLANEIVKN
jgi:hypothetical protein